MTLIKPQSTPWTLKSLLQATGLALAGMMITMQLNAWKLWPDIPWSFLVLPGLIGSGFLAMRHPGTGLLTTLLFFPLLLVMMFYVAACLPLQPGR